MGIYQHFREEEHPFIDKVLSWIEDVEVRHQIKLTDFLNPREQDIISSVIGKNDDVNLFFSGGAEVERKRAIIAPYYHHIEEADFQINLLESSYPIKFATIEHRDVLGSFLSMGIKRKKLGDLIVQDGKIQIIVSSEIASYVSMNLKKIKNATVTFEEKPLQSLMEKKQMWEQYAKTVSSLRLDAVMKEIYHISRQLSSTSIQKGLVKVNFRIVDNPSFLLQQGDLISLRGKGRSKLTEVNGLTKKEKWKIIIEKLT